MIFVVRWIGLADYFRSTLQKCKTQTLWPPSSRSLARFRRRRLSLLLERLEDDERDFGSLRSLPHGYDSSTRRLVGARLPNFGRVRASSLLAAPARAQASAQVTNRRPPTSPRAHQSTDRLVARQQLTTAFTRARRCCRCCCCRCCRCCCCRCCRCCRCCGCCLQNASATERTDRRPPSSQLASGSS